MSASHQRALLWIAIIGTALGGVGAVFFAHIIPPVSPNLSIAEISQFYQTDVNAKRFGFMLMMFGNALLFPLYGAISEQMRRMQGVSPMLNYTQLALGAGNVVIIVLPSVIFTGIAYDPMLDPQVIAGLHNVAWILLVMPVSSFSLQQLVIGFGILGDRSPIPVLPRWLGYLSFWTALIYLPAFGVTFFRHGPFAWNGILAFYVAVMAFVIWQICMYVQLFKNIRHQAVDREADDRTVREA